MSKKFDATLKTLLELSPDDWPVLVGRPRGRAKVINADVSTVTAGADKVLRVNGRPPWLLHLEFQRGPDRSLPLRMHVYNALLEERHGLAVCSVAVLLSPRANLSNLAGTYRQQLKGEPAYLTFTYRVLRVWELPVEPLLTGGPGVLPLAPISAVTEAEVPSVIRRIKERLSEPPLTSEAARLWTATYVLMGLRYKAGWVDHLLEGVGAMEESVTYQAIVEKGRVQELRRVLLLQGTNRFGPPDAQVTAALEAMSNVTVLERLAVRLLKADSWAELLESASKGARRRKQPRNGKPEAT
jgi:predicted transposase YdaD